MMTGGGGGGGDDQNFRGMYRPWNGIKSYGMLLPPVHKAFLKFFPWPPKRCCYFSSGYYFDLDNGDGDLRDNELMIHNLPPGTTQAQIKKQFPGAKGITINPDGTAIIEFKTPPEATSAYNNSNLVKLGKNHLGWVRDDELYLLSVPANVTEDDLKTEFPDATEVLFQQGPDGNRIATMKFKTPQDADKSYADAPYKKLGNHQLGYSVSINPIKLTNLPSGLSEGDIKKKFPSAKTVEVNKATGTAKLVFDNDDNALKAYEDSDLLKLGKPKLGWLRPEELYLEGVPSNLTEAELLKEYPTAKKVKLQKGEGGKRIATIIRPSEAEQKKAYDGSTYTKLGPQRLGWTPDGSGPGGKGGKSGGGGGGKDSQLKIKNIPNELSEDDLKNKFPGAGSVKINKDGSATIQYGSPGEAKKAYEDSSLLKLGGKTLGWLRPEELYLQGVPPNIKDADLMKEFPNAKSIKWQKGEGGKRVATIVFPSEADQKKAYDDSKFNKIGPQILGFTPGGMTNAKKGGKKKEDLGGVQDVDNTDDLTDDELAKKLWKLGDVGFSNISNLFTPAINISGLPNDVNRVAIMKLYDGVKKVDITTTKNGKVAQVEFDNPGKAAHAYGISKKLALDGHQLTVHPVKVGAKKGGGTKSSKTGSGKSASKSGKSRGGKSTKSAASKKKK